MIKKAFAVLLALSVVTPTFGAYEEIECSSDSVFSEYSCNQCFNGGSKSEGTYIGLLSDLWENTGESTRIMYKEQQDFPEMVNLDTDNVEWSQTPSGDDFWEYTPEFDALYSETDDGYLLKAGESVTWLKSKLSYAFKLEKNDTTADANVGLLIYPLLSHVLLDNGDMPKGSSVHNECVLFKSGAPTEDNSVEPRKLPETGPAEFLLLLILAMILGFGILKVRTNS